MSAHSPSRMRRDDGAVAILVALVAVVLFVMAAFTVDFGYAYSVKRQLSVASDAAAIAGAKAVNALLPYGTACKQADADYGEPLQVAAQSAAEQTNDSNDPAHPNEVGTVTVTCTSNGVEVMVPNSRTLGTVFGGVIGVKTMTPATSATALLTVPPAYGGVRPIAACVSDVKVATAARSEYVVFIDKIAGACDTASTGNWAWTDFTDQGQYDDNYTDPCGGGGGPSGGNTGCLSAWLRYGYGGSVKVPNNYAQPPTAPLNKTGMHANTGWDNAVMPDVRSLVGKTILLPVVTGMYVSTGLNKTRLDVVGMAAVEVCSVNEGSGSPPPTIFPSTWQTITTPGCNAMAPAGSPADTTPPAELTLWNNFKNNGAAIWVHPVTYATTGVYGPGGCKIGDTTCDFGARGIVLWR